MTPQARSFAAPVALSVVSKLMLLKNALEGSFSPHIEILNQHIGRFSIRPDGKDDAARAHRVFAFGLISKRVVVVVFHRESFFLRARNDREPAPFFHDRDLAK